MKPQKALHLHIEEEKKKPKHLGHDYAVFEKYDGWYGYLDLSEGLVRSRAGRVIPSCLELSKEIMASTHHREGIVIFEILIKGVKEFSELNGMLNRSVGDCTARGAYVMCHDFLTDVNKTFRHRYKELFETFEFNSIVRQVRYIDVSASPTIWRSRCQEIWDKGGEGIILKRVDAPYSPDKRNFDLMKIKEEVTLDLLVVDVAAGQGKYSDVVGVLIVQDKLGNRHSISGMTDENRAEWRMNKQSIIGSVVEVKAMKINTDGSLREPRFKAIRYDKTVQDID